MTTSFIRVPMTGAAPEDYLVSGAASIDLLSAAANFDGSGSGVDFQPAIQVLDESGQVVATALGSVVAAGGSAEVTFAPFLKQQVTSGGGITTPTTEIFAVVNLTVPALATVAYPFTHDQGVVLSSGGGSTTPSILAAGVYCYVFSANAAGSTAFTAGRPYWIETEMAVPFASTLAQSSSYPGTVVGGSRISTTLAEFMPAGATLLANVVNLDSVSHLITCVAYLSKIG